MTAAILVVTAVIRFFMFYSCDLYLQESLLFVKEIEEQPTYYDVTRVHDYRLYILGEEARKT